VTVVYRLVFFNGSAADLWKSLSRLLWIACSQMQQCLSWVCMGGTWGKWHLERPVCVALLLVSITVLTYLQLI